MLFFERWKISKVYEKLVGKMTNGMNVNPGSEQKQNCRAIKLKHIEIKS